MKIKTKYLVSDFFQFNMEAANEDRVFVMALRIKVSKSSLLDIIFVVCLLARKSVLKW